MNALPRGEGRGVTMAKHRIAVVGAGFGGLEFTRAMRSDGVSIILVDKRNHHLF